MVREGFFVCSSGIFSKIRQHNMTSLKTDDNLENTLVRMNYPRRQTDQHKWITKVLVRKN